MLRRGRRERGFADSTELLTALTQGNIGGGTSSAHAEAEPPASQASTG